MSEKRPVVTREHLPGLLLAQRECRRYEDLQFLNFLIDKARSAGPVEAGMSDKVLIARELLERIVNAPSLTDEGEAIDKLRALLTAQPQASAAQSAPAGEREAFEAAWHSGAFRDSMFPERHPGMWDAFQAGASWQRTQSAALFGGDERQHIICACPDCLAEAQRTQSAGAPDGESLAELLESVRLGDDEAKPHGSGATYWNNAVIACQVAIRDALAAPAQPAAQSVMCHGCFAQGVAPDHFDAAGKCKAMQPAAHDQGEVQRLREALEKFEPYLAEKVHYASDAADDCRYWRVELFIRTPARNPEPFDVAAEKWIRAALAASTGQEV